MPGADNEIHTEIFAIDREDTNRVCPILQDRDVVLMGYFCDRFHLMHVAILVIDVVNEGQNGHPSRLAPDLLDLCCCRISSNLMSGILGDLTNNTPILFPMARNSV